MTRDRPADQNTVRNLDSPRQLAEWANTLVAHHRRQLASTTPPLRHASGTASAGIDDSSVAWLLRTWEDLSAGFVRLQHKNLLVDGADPAVLATAFMAAFGEQPIGRTIAAVRDGTGEDAPIASAMRTPSESRSQAVVVRRGSTQAGRTKWQV
jgi:hypothetical protein